MTIQAVFFDMGGTIEKFWATPTLRLEATPGLQELLHSAGLDLGLNDRSLCDVVVSGFRRYHDLSLQTMDELSPVQVWSKYILEGFPFDPARVATAAEELMHYFEARFFHRELRPEVPMVLETLQKLDLKIGMISNTCSLGLVPGKLEEYKIRHYFDPLVLSSEYGRRKPDPAIFHHAARLANVPTSKCLYVGDRVTRDVIGAHKAGFRLAVQIHNDFNHGEADEGDIPDASITNMNELLAIVEDELRIPNHKKSNNPLGSEIQAIFFDAGDVLYYREQIGSRLNKFLAGLGLDPNRINNDDSKVLMVQAHRGQITQDQYRESILHMCGIDQPEQIKHGKQIMAEEDDAVTVFPGVLDTLRSLKAKGFLMGIITDTSQPLTVKLKWFERGGFVNIWDSIIPSWEVGINKPHPEIYNLALQQVGVRSDQAIFVGHNAYELAGARSVGIRTVAFNYDEDAKADYYIKDFAELLTVPILSEQKQELLYGK